MFNFKSLPVFRHALRAIVLLAAAAGGASGYTVKKDIPYLESADGPKLDMYLPAGASAARRAPGFVWIHGGGWSGGQKDAGREVALCTTLALAGYVAVSIDYVLSDSNRGTWPENLQQCKAAIRFLRRYAATYGVDTANIAVGGGSAGAHLAVLAGLTGESRFLSDTHKGWSSKVKAILDLYGPVSTYDWYGGSTRKMLQVNSQTDPLIAQSSAETYISKGIPPVFIAHGLEDAIVDPIVSRNFAARLTAAGAEHRLVMIPGALHTFNLEKSGGKPLSVDLKSMFLQWLDSKMRSPVGAREALPGPNRVRIDLGGRFVTLPEAWGKDVSGIGSDGMRGDEITLELRDRNGRQTADQRMSLRRLANEASPLSGMLRPLPAGVYVLTLRQGARAFSVPLAVWK